MTELDEEFLVELDDWPTSCAACGAPDPIWDDVLGFCCVDCGSTDADD